MIKLLVDCRMIDSSGIGVYTKELLKRFSKDELLDVYVLINFDQNLPCDVIVDVSRIIKTKVHKFSLKSFYKNNSIIESFDVYFIPFLSIPPIFIRKTKVISTVHDLCPVSMRRFFGWKKSVIYLCMMLVQCFFSKKIISISNFTRSELNKYSLNFFKQKIIVIPNGVRKIKSLDLSPRNKPDSEKYGICVGNVKPHKNIFPLVDYLTGKSFDKKLFVIGDIEGFSTGYSKELFENLPSNIIFTGKVSDEALHQYFLNAEFMIFPSLYEGFGLPLLEAMQYEIKIIASRIPVFYEIAGDSVLYFDPSTFENLDEIINAPLWNENFKDIYKDVLNKYSWDRSADMLIGVFCEKNTYSK